MGALALAFSAVAGLVRYRWSFGGEIYLAEGVSERAVVRPAGRTGPARPRGGNRLDSAAPVEIPFGIPVLSCRKLDPNQLYDAAFLPFSVQLTQAETLDESPPRHSIKIKMPEAETESEVVTGGEVDIAGDSFHVEEIRKWSGLLSDPTGLTAACFSICLDGEACTEDVFVLAGRWLRMEPGIAVLFSWTNSEAAAREAVSHLPGIESARWGVADRGSVNWFSSFTPGLGATLSDGTSVTLTQLAENGGGESGEGPAIEVRFEGAGSETVWVGANDMKPNARVRFEYPARLPNVILIQAWRDRSALFAAYQNGHKCGEQVLDRGQLWRPPGFAFDLRLEDAMEKGAPVSRENSVLYEAVLTRRDERLRLRQGETARRGDALVEFVRVAESPAMRYTFSVTSEGGVGDRKFTLGPGEHARVGQWTFSLIPGGADAKRCAVLRAERTVGAGWVYAPLILGVMALILVGVRSWRSGPMGS